MNQTIYYFLQVMLCSAIMYAYYLIALRNKKFHQYNRYYLLFAAVFSWIIPLIKININNATAKAEPVNNLIQIVASNNTEVENFVVTNNVKYIDWISILNISYIAVSAVLLFVFFGALVKIFRLLKANSAKQIDGVHLILTNDSSTPFSFFKYIFWNRAIDIQTNEGKQMLQHELTHVKEKHSTDKIIMQLVIILGWANPVFWIMRRELSMIHEFIADKKAVADGDASTLANMLLYAAYPKQHYLLTNPLFFSPIKRRIIMMTKNTNPKFSYLRRLVILPLLAVVVMLFAFRANNESNVKLDKTYTVVIDAGHGGTDGGAIAPDGTKESDLAIAFAKAVQAANTNKNIKIILSRTEDVTQSVSDKAKFAVENKADLFVSFHLNSVGNSEKHKVEWHTSRGLEVVVPRGDRSNYTKESIVFGMNLADELSNKYSPVKISTRQVGIWVLQNSGCPAIILECGFISNESDLKLLKSSEYHNYIAMSVLKSIGQYFAMSEKGELQKNIDNLKMTDSTGIFFKGEIKKEKEQQEKYSLKTKDGNKVVAKKYPDTLVWVKDFDNGSKKIDANIVYEAVMSHSGKYSSNNTKDNADYWTDSLISTGNPKNIDLNNIKETIIVLNGKVIPRSEYPLNKNKIRVNAVIYENYISAEEAVEKYKTNGKNGGIEFTIDKKYFKE